MPTPYDEEPAVDTARIRELNDAFRCDPNPIGAQLRLGTLVVTSGVAARGTTFVDRAVRAVREYADFTEENDPHGEHDFGAFTLDDAELFWKIDLYERELVNQTLTGTPSTVHQCLVYPRSRVVPGTPLLCQERNSD